MLACQSGADKKFNPKLPDSENNHCYSSSEVVQVCISDAAYIVFTVRRFEN